MIEYDQTLEPRPPDAHTTIVKSILLVLWSAGSMFRRIQFK